MKGKSKLLKAGILCLASLSLVGCGKDDGLTADGKVEIEYFNQKKEMTDTIREIAQDFEAQNPDIKIKVVDVPAPGDVLKTRVLAGDLPDVMNTYPQSFELQEWAKAGYLEDVKDQPFMKNLKEGYAEKYEVEGGIYNVPLSANMYGFYYNATKFKELGYEVPETWAEFEALVDQMIADGQVPFAIAGSEGWTLNGYHQLAIATVTGGFQPANDYLRFSQPNSISADDEILKADAQRLDLLRRPGAMQQNWQGASYTDALATFARGDALMTVNGSWALTMINEQEPQFEVATFPFPGNNPGESLTIGSGDFALSISATTPHKEEALRFVEYLTTPEAMQKYYDVDGSPVTVKGVKMKEDSELAGLAQYAFTDKHIVWLAQNWTSENDYYTLTTNYLTTGDLERMAQDLNAFFNPMKADVK